VVSSDEFQPNWCSPPGETIADILKDRALSVSAFARLLGQTEDRAAALLTGQLAIDHVLAHKLAELLGASAAFWRARETQYRSELNRLASATAPDEWLASLPVADMMRWGWVPRHTRPAEKMSACLQFFGVRSPGEWKQQYNEPLAASAFRTSPTFPSEVGAVTAWLRQGELLSEAIECAPWSADGLRAALPKMRALTKRRDPNTFLSELQSICAANGVAVVIARAPSGCRASGATRFLSADKALVLLSFRHLSDDHFWFTFFHEVGHLLLHSTLGVLVDLDGDPTSPTEAEANEFAARTLIPLEFQDQMKRVPLLARPIIRLAMQIGVSPGILVGQLQHAGRLGRDKQNGLKRRFTWKD
jgi:HTH-type transcriptional regulator / antitoxin HigA